MNRMKKLLEAATDVPGGHDALTKMIKKNRPVPEGLVNPPDNAEDEEVRSPSPPSSPVLHIRKAPLKRKQRIPWSEEEERFLIKLINKHGNKWAYFEAKYGRKALFGRNQVALKDKARNILRRIIDSGNEEVWVRKYPKWSEVTVGTTCRRGVHDYDRYSDGLPPKETLQMRREKMVVEESEDDSEEEDRD